MTGDITQTDLKNRSESGLIQVQHILKDIEGIDFIYLEREELLVERMGRGMAWLDTGTHQSLLEAAHFIEVVEARQGLRIACPEEVAYRMGYIDAGQVRRLAEPLAKSGYGTYLLKMLESDVK